MGMIESHSNLMFCKAAEDLAEKNEEIEALSAAEDRHLQVIEAHKDQVLFL